VSEPSPSREQLRAGFAFSASFGSVGWRLSRSAKKSRLSGVLSFDEERSLKKPRSGPGGPVPGSVTPTSVSRSASFCASEAAS
jgi:hypothetical protein